MSGGKHRGRKILIPDSAAESKKGKDVILSDMEKAVLGVKDEQSRNNDVSISLKYWDTTHECFSTWEKDELKLFSAFKDTLSALTWPQIFATGGSGGTKAGLGYTLHKSGGKLPYEKILRLVSPEISFFELRLSKKIRVHGFRCVSCFYLVWLDRNHAAFPE